MNTITINGKEVEIKRTAYTNMLYKNKFKRNLNLDINDLAFKFKELNESLKLVNYNELMVKDLIIKLFDEETILKIVWVLIKSKSLQYIEYDEWLKELETSYVDILMEDGFIETIF